ncbi:MAG TPA: enediyne biosynthesis protein UnbU [Cyanothece sp. UBA12306]|nr:enediyne biosynthesis protein UnbU [Cyanothece sp. UBA12306]
MTITQSLSSFNFTPIPQAKAKTTNNRLAGLRRFAIAITFLNILGHTFLGFEQSWAQPFVSLLAAYGMELLLETVEAFQTGKAPRFLGNLTTFIDFLLPAHITGLAVAMLLYANERLFPIAFAAAVAIASKYLFRVTIGNKLRHFLNPSNFGISVTLLLFPWIGIAPPYQFTENLYGWADWIFPVIIVCTGTFLNARFTHKLPLILGWIGGFIFQAAIRSYWFETPLIAGLLPMTGVAFVLFTFYMISDPGTTPITTKSQLFFGFSVGLAYGILMLFHVVFGMFFGLTFVCLIRGLIYYLNPLVKQKYNSVKPLLIN